MSSDQIYAGNRTMEPGRRILRNRSMYTAFTSGRLRTKSWQYSPEAVCLRLPWMYDFPWRGVKEQQQSSGNLLKSLIHNRPLTLPVYDYRGITWAMEVVKHVGRREAAPGGVYNFGGGNTLSTYETAGKCAGDGDRGGGQKRTSYSGPGTVCRQPRNLLMDTEKIRGFGIIFPDTVEGFQRCFEEGPEYMLGLIR